MDSGEDHHRIVVLHAVDFIGNLTRIDICNLLVHIEEVTVTLQNRVDAETVDRLGEVEEHSQTGVVDTEALVATLLGSTRCNVTRHEVAECRITTLQIVVAVFLGYIRPFLRAGLQCLGVFELLWNPDAAVVTQRL